MNIHPALLTCSLFSSISSEELSAILACLNARQQDYRKGDCLVLQGSRLAQIGVLLEGTASIQQESYDGRIFTLSELEPGDSFGEAYVYANTQHLPVSVWATSAAKVVYLDFSKMITPCAAGCAFHTRLISNMLGLMAQKLISLNMKIQIMQKATTQEKLMALFEFYASQAQSNCFELPFSRNGLAEYLSVNRSAMSRELSRLQKAGILALNGRTVTLL